jgi:hypothetical protein
MLGTTLQDVILLIRHVLQCLTPDHETGYAVSYMLTQFKYHSTLYATCEEQSGTANVLLKVHLVLPVLAQWDSFGSPDILEYMEIKLPISSQGRVPFTILLDQRRPWGSRDRVKRRKFSAGWISHMALWQGLAGTQRQARELISCPCITATTRLLSFNRMQSRVVIGLLTGHNTLRRHLHIMGERQSLV